MANKQKIKIVIVDKINLDSLNLFSKNKFEVVCDFGISNEDVLKKYSGYDVLVIRSIRTIDKKFISKCNFKIIATCSRGFDNIDAASAKRKKIRVLNCEKGNAVSAAEHTMGLILCAMKNITFSNELTRSGKFNFYDYNRNELFGKKIGIIGYGNVGSYVGKLCRAFGMKIFANDTDKKVRDKYPQVNFKNLKFILENCDIVTLHIPLDEKNFHFINKEKLKLIGRNTVLINTSRGAVIDEKELVRKLNKSMLRYICLDVFENEPSLNRETLKIKNATLTNHIAGKTEESSAKMVKELFEKIIKSYK
ncbi:MAG: hypothetical protein JSS63_14030 [Bacteroidetes bacterium]|nr:hypothetical protein [Bacteroidota bacterium]